MSLTSQQTRSISLGAAVRNHRPALILSAVFSAIAAACSLAPFFAVYAVTVALFIAEDASTIAMIVGLAAAALVLRAVASAISSHVGHVAAYRILEELRLGIGQNLQHLPLGAVQARSSGEMKKILHDDIEQLEEVLAHGIPDGAAAVSMPIVTILAMFIVDWRLALLALGALVLLVVVSGIGMTLAQKNNRALAEHSLVLNRAVMGYLHGIRVIRAYLRADAGFDRAKDAVVTGAELQDAATSGPLRWLVAGMGAAMGLAVLVVVLAAIGELPGLALDSGTVWGITALLGAALLARVLATAWSNQLVWHLAAQSKADLQLSILDRLRRVPLGFFQRFDAGRAGATVTSDIPMLDF
ncbi:ABC transporter ATP-binding protein [Gulosibacter chungangensis]|uniref:ABC transporter ATP-binding protein n=1 Tax=Gulosibacter chungangensis TaxID=979746 RepID=UPI0017885E47|nr:ABC transporter ATP-binding protein [Gulosibacter chungangensis]